MERRRYFRNDTTGIISVVLASQLEKIYGIFGYYYKNSFGNFEPFDEYATISDDLYISGTNESVIEVFEQIGNEFIPVELKDIATGEYDLVCRFWNGSNEKEITFQSTTHEVEYTEVTFNPLSEPIFESDFNHFFGQFIIQKAEIDGEESLILQRKTGLSEGDWFDEIMEITENQAEEIKELNSSWKIKENYFND